MNIKTLIEPIANIERLITQLLVDEYKVDTAIAMQVYQENAKRYFLVFNENAYIVSETPYTDKVYRNSYYNYYSSKFGNYNRTCIKLSFFEGEVAFDDFINPDKIEDLKVRYRGFIILRPTLPNIIGRSVISPKILKENDFICCSSNYKSSSQGIKLFVDGFPHCAQDGETISCAETTLMTAMEFFGNYYQEYCTVLPSKIIETLHNVTSERQLPTHGLYITQSSFALREYGLGTRIYSRKIFGLGIDKEFERLFSIYSESKIPLIVNISNNHTGKGVVHSLLCIGREEKVSDAEIDNLKPIQIPAELLKRKDVANSQATNIEDNVEIFDWHDAAKKFIFMDDNCPVYQKATFQDPSKHYIVDNKEKSKEWSDCMITHFIAPLHPKIYLEATKAYNFLHTLLLSNNEMALKVLKSVLIKMYLTTSRSYKNYLTLENTFQSNLKKKLIALDMPKFIWLAEITDKDRVKRSEAVGLVLIDATEANTRDFKPLITAAYENKLSYFSSGGILKSEEFPLSAFKMFLSKSINF